MDTSLFVQELPWHLAMLLVFAAAMYFMARGRWAVRRTYVLVLWLLPLVQAAVVVTLVHAAFEVGAAWYVMFALVVAGALCAAGDVLAPRGFDVAIERDRAAERTRVLEQQLAFQQRYFETLAAERQKAQRVREDFARELAEVRRSVGLHERERALEAVDGAAAVLKPAVKRYCENRVVDALLVGKEAEFKEAGVRFECTASVPQHSGFSDIVLCAAFSNVLSNAAHACDELPAGERWVEVGARADEGSFVLRVQNSCSGDPSHEPPRPAPRGLDDAHGWGLEILRLLAKDHDGTLAARRERDRFVTELVLTC